jgi:hypothetical protein
MVREKASSDPQRPFQPYVPPVTGTDPAADEGAGVPELPDGDGDPEDPANNP